MLLVGAFVCCSIAWLPRSPITVTSLDNTQNGSWHSGYPIILDFFWTYCCWIRSAKATICIDRIESANQSIVPSIQAATAIYYCLMSGFLKMQIAKMASHFKPSNFPLQKISDFWLCKLEMGKWLRCRQAIQSKQGSASLQICDTI